MGSKKGISLNIVCYKRYNNFYNTENENKWIWTAQLLNKDWESKQQQVGIATERNSHIHLYMYACIGDWKLKKAPQMRGNRSIQRVYAFIRRASFIYKINCFLFKAFNFIKFLFILLFFHPSFSRDIMFMCLSVYF